MSLPYFPHEIHLEGVKGVGTIQLNLEPQQQVYCLIGTNGVGKTKLLERLFLNLLCKCSHIFNHKEFKEKLSSLVESRELDFKRLSQGEMDRNFVYIGTHVRSLLTVDHAYVEPLGSLSERRTNYFSQLIYSLDKPIASLDSQTNLHNWIVSRALSSNPYQKKEDNRQIEIQTVLKLLHQIDQRVDPEFLEITGEPRVFIKIEGQKRELSQLSSGFTSILKIIQSIVSGYGYFTNEVQLQHVAGLVLIDEIESHLHNQWLVKIIPMLKQLFPNTIFVVTTHSPIVLTQLKHGEAYRLQRDDDGVVRSHLINHPDKAAFVDLLNDAFGVDLNQQKLDRISAHDQQHVKTQLLDWLSEE